MKHRYISSRRNGEICFTMNGLWAPMIACLSRFLVKLNRRGESEWNLGLLMFVKSYPPTGYGNSQTSLFWIAMHIEGPVSPNLNPESRLFEIWILNPSHFEIWIPENHKYDQSSGTWILNLALFEIWILDLALFEIWIQNPWSVWNLNPESLDPPYRALYSDEYIWHVSHIYIHLPAFRLIAKCHAK